MNIKRIRRIAGVLTGLAGALLALVAAPAAAFAVTYPLPPNGGAGSSVYAPPQPPVHTVIVGGMPGWQIALIAVGAALVAAIAAVLLYRARAVQRKPVTAAA
jgi:hypothetical protein